MSYQTQIALTLFIGYVIGLITMAVVVYYIAKNILDHKDD